MICKRGIACQLLRVDARREVSFTPEQTAAVKDQSIDFSDIPELDEEFWDRAEVVKRDRTDQITMRAPRGFAPPAEDYPGPVDFFVRADDRDHLDGGTRSARAIRSLRCAMPHGRRAFDVSWPGSE